MGVYFVINQALYFIVIPEISHGGKWSTGLPSRTAHYGTPDT